MDVWEEDLSLDGEGLALDEARVVDATILPMVEYGEESVKERSMLCAIEL